MEQILALIGALGVFGVAIWLASKNGSKAAQLEALKSELKKQAEEQKHEQKILDSVRNMSDDDVHSRLQKTGDK